MVREIPFDFPRRDRHAGQEPWSSQPVLVARLVYLEGALWFAGDRVRLGTDMVWPQPSRVDPDHGQVTPTTADGSAVAPTGDPGGGRVLAAEVRGEAITLVELDARTAAVLRRVPVTSDRFGGWTDARRGDDAGAGAVTISRIVAAGPVTWVLCEQFHGAPGSVVAGIGRVGPDGTVETWRPDRRGSELVRGADDEPVADETTGWVELPSAGSPRPSSRRGMRSGRSPGRAPRCRGKRRSSASTPARRHRPPVGDGRVHLHGATSPTAPRG